MPVPRMTRASRASASPGAGVGPPALRQRRRGWSSSQGRLWTSDASASSLTPASPSDSPAPPAWARASPGESEALARPIASSSLKSSQSLVNVSSMCETNRSPEKNTCVDVSTSISKAESPPPGSAIDHGNISASAEPAASSPSPDPWDDSVPADCALSEAVLCSWRPLPLPGLPPGERARHVACNGRFLAVKTGSTAVRLWRLTNDHQPQLQPLPLLLLPHPDIQCMTLHQDGGALLVTCARNILLWNLTDPAAGPVTLGEEFSDVACCHLVESGGAAVLSLGVMQHVWLLDVAAVRHVTTLRGHESAVTCVHLQGTVCAAGSEGGQLKVWDTRAQSLLYSSHVLAPRAVLAVSVDADTWLVAAGCGGQVSVVGQAADRWTEVATVCLERSSSAEGGGGSPRAECAALAVTSLRRPTAALLGPHRLLLVATTTGLVVLNTRTWLPEHSVPQSGPEPWGSSCLAVTPAGPAVVCACSALAGDVTAMTLNVTSPDVEERLSALSIVCRSEIPAGSALRSRPDRPPPPAKAAPGGRKVRSSGYGAPNPRRLMFQPRTNAARAKADPSRLSLSNLPSVSQRPAVSPEPPAGHRRVRYRCDVAAAEASRPLRILGEGDTLLRVALSGSGRHLACSTRQGRSVEVARLSGLDLGRGRFLLGSHGAVTSVAWSLSADQLVAVSAAGINLWGFPSGEPIAKRPAAKLAFTCAQFFFMDEFILAAGEDSVNLLRIAEEAGQKKSLRSVLRCRLPCREVAHVAGAVQFRSALAAACCSDHSLRLLDLHTGQTVTTLKRAHPHPAHLAGLWEGAPHVAAPAPLYHLLGSVSVADGVRLWDLRSGRLAQRLIAPQLRALPAGFQMSPCGRLLAAGGDAAAVSLWDVRRPRGPLARMRTAAAGVSDVAFHPRRPGLVAALLDGRLQSWPLGG